MAIRFTSIERVSHEEGRRRETAYWASKTMAERVMAGWELAEDDWSLHKDHEPEKPTGITLRRIKRSPR